MHIMHACQFKDMNYCLFYKDAYLSSTVTVQIIFQLTQNATELGGNRKRMPQKIACLRMVLTHVAMWHDIPCFQLKVSY